MINISYEGWRKRPFNAEYRRAMANLAGGKPTVIVPLRSLRNYIENMLIAAGCSTPQAKIAGDVFVEADLRGHPIQGIDHIDATLDSLLSGRIAIDARPEVVRRALAALQIDAHGGLGQPAAIFASEQAIAVARDAGCAVVGLVNADDVFMVGYYVERIARAGLIGIAMISTFPPRVRHPCGTEAVLGRNPIAIAIPIGIDDPIIMDFATSSLAIGDVRIASYFDDVILPAGLAFDDSGLATQDPRATLSGSLAPFSGMTGFGLGLCAALIGGALAAGVVGVALERAMIDGASLSASRGNLFIAIDPDSFGHEGSFAARAAEWLRVRHPERQRETCSDLPLRIPGCRTFRARAQSLE